MEVLFPHDKLLNIKILPRNPLPPNAPPRKKVPLEYLYNSQFSLPYVNNGKIL